MPIVNAGSIGAVSLPAGQALPARQPFALSISKEKANVPGWENIGFEWRQLLVRRIQQMQVAGAGFEPTTSRL